MTLQMEWHMDESFPKTWPMKGNPFHDVAKDRKLKYILPWNDQWKELSFPWKKIFSHDSPNERQPFPISFKNERTHFPRQCQIKETCPPIKYPIGGTFPHDTAHAWKSFSHDFTNERKPFPMTYLDHDDGNHHQQNIQPQYSAIQLTFDYF